MAEENISKQNKNEPQDVAEKPNIFANKTVAVTRYNFPNSNLPSHTHLVIKEGNIFKGKKLIHYSK